jgi:hypothetical protein
MSDLRSQAGHSELYFIGNIFLRISIIRMRIFQRPQVLDDQLDIFAVRLTPHLNAPARNGNALADFPSSRPATCAAQRSRFSHPLFMFLWPQFRDVGFQELVDLRHGERCVSAEIDMRELALVARNDRPPNTNSAWGVRSTVVQAMRPINRKIASTVSLCAGDRGHARAWILSVTRSKIC